MHQRVEVLEEIREVVVLTALRVIKRRRLDETTHGQTIMVRYSG